MVAILSHNVAGWAPFLKLIIEQFGSIEEYMKKLRVDVLCYQEIKVQRNPLATKPGELGFGPDSKVDAFFACSPSGGYNGVATIVRPGLTSSGDAQCLGGAFDGDGRCVLTRHGDRTVLNVYVPATFNDEKLGYKMRFLVALRGKVDAEMAAGQFVILAGDLNIARRGIDCHPSSRRVDVALLSQCPYTAAHEAAIREALADVAVVQNGQGFRVTIGGALVGRTWSSRTDAEADAKGYRLEEQRVEENNEVYVLSLADHIAISRLKEVVRVVTPRPLNADEVDFFASKGVSSSPTCAVAWLERLVGTDGVLADLWAEEQPLAQCRATCWNQSHNGRFNNSGNRLDYGLVDRRLCPEIERGTAETSEAHALALATARGRWQQAPMDGGGIPDDAAQPAYDDQFNPEPGTRGARMVYTPPKYSDHIAVAVTLPGVTFAAQVLNRDKRTRHAQPHRTLTPITSFFTKPQSASPIVQGGQVPAPDVPATPAEPEPVPSPDVPATPTKPVLVETAEPTEGAVRESGASTAKKPKKRAAGSGGSGPLDTFVKKLPPPAP